ncbi:hypothetical protein GCM10022233_69500 [Streptomyces shaanxiensis]|uniref:Uncharacterized protein n=1 Tax=Streptomyces shaanxiensis TaxID=653357 RepID=A0ABP7W353_9ACTN
MELVKGRSAYLRPSGPGLAGSRDRLGPEQVGARTGPVRRSALGRGPGRETRTAPFGREASLITSHRTRMAWPTITEHSGHQGFGQLRLEVTVLLLKRGRPRRHGSAPLIAGVTRR